MAEAVRERIDRDAVREDTPLRLDVAARLAFPDGSIGLSSLRREAAKGRLTVWRIAGKDMTTLAEIREMMTRCRVQQNPRDCGLDQPAKSANPSGSSSTGDANIALAAARLRLQRLNESSPSMSEPSVTRRPSRNVVPIKR